ncbi:hypothetical protein SPNIH35_00760 [Streptococcus pyogenes]|nr:hypothetical protein HMPREF0841_1784 [Streptococcus pyogenes ATCC 10782]BAV54379.1 hypothetical protein JMUB1235_0114 [Streptococcus pyogenes]BCK37371.1 hypothetical protein SPNIH35_00760 [Streptococcus pyogenes]BCK39122.1 hypothetical protein KUN2590_00770 [Streptococcus pyogenes]
MQALSKFGIMINEVFYGEMEHETKAYKSSKIRSLGFGAGAITYVETTV